MRLNKIILFLLVLLPYAVIKSQSCPSIKDALGNSDVTITCSYIPKSVRNQVRRGASTFHIFKLPI